MKWTENPPEDFEWDECCWVKPNIWGEDEPTVGELSRHTYPNALGEHGVIIDTINGGIDIETDSVKRWFCRIPPPPEQGWLREPPNEIGWYWVRNEKGSILPVEVYVDYDEKTLVCTGINSFYSRTPVADPYLSWVRIALPE